MTLNDYYKKLKRGERMAFFRSVRRATGVSITTASRWCIGDSTPQNPEHLTALSKLTNIPITNLFKTIKK